MVIGTVLFVVAILAVLVGTKDSEASVLYYDADFVPAEEEREAFEQVSETEEFVQDGLHDEQPVVAPQSIKSAKREQPQPASSVEDLKKAATENDPNAAAQALFNSLKGGKL